MHHKTSNNLQHLQQKKALEESILRGAFRLPLCWVYETDSFGLTFLRPHSALIHTVAISARCAVAGSSSISCPIRVRFILHERFFMDCRITDGFGEIVGIMPDKYPVLWHDVIDQ